ncbi:MAG TPA: hypothetical protein VFQ61_22465, partial [Polyangiaceae bacterium]|nr:hypothetical protein [Polyangiaceae bacterium]
SSEAIARLLPAITAAARAASIHDPALRLLYASTYTAFRKRRSLLLLNLERQTKLGDLPWIRAIQPWVGGDSASAAASREVLCDAAVLTLSAFPQTIVPNKLVKELRALAAASGSPLPFVEELAADIFMGTFSETYLKAAQLAAGLLRSTLYERYYGIPYDRILTLNDIQKVRRGDLAWICHSLAAACVQCRAIGRARELRCGQWHGDRASADSDDPQPRGPVCGDWCGRGFAIAASGAGPSVFRMDLP